MATLQDLQARIAKLKAQAEQIAKKQSLAVLAKIRDLMEKHGLTTADIDAYDISWNPGTGKVARNYATAARYRNPRTLATWTGHGRAPAWIANAKNRDRFLIDGETATSPAAAKQPKPGGYVRGPQAPKYRDPATGATWSGRGKAPAWLAGAKDRTAYLIDTATRKAAASEAAPAKKSAAENVAPKKVGARKTATKRLQARR
jgi:DNA-binding protein H-NS